MLVANLLLLVRRNDGHSRFAERSHQLHPLLRHVTAVPNDVFATVQATCVGEVDFPGVPDRSPKHLRLMPDLGLPPDNLCLNLDLDLKADLAFEVNVQWYMSPTL
ncbi:hypothetical protein C0J52_12486 [Blattella germanica]|nr:hypothetical protein C0J52_12486 [Blattella germanica]